MASQQDVTVRMPRVDEIVPPAARAALLQQLAVLAIGRIKRRTKEGIGFDGQAFAPYSAGYAARRRRAGFQTTPDLWLRGGMLNGMGVLEVTPDRALIGFSGSSARTRFALRTRTRRKQGGHFVGVVTTRVAAPVTNKKTGAKVDLVVQETGGRIANAQKAYFNQNGKKPRKFFGLSKEDRLFLTKHALRELLRIVGQVSLSRAARR
jgi:hypothetical protein